MIRLCPSDLKLFSQAYERVRAVRQLVLNLESALCSAQISLLLAPCAAMQRPIREDDTAAAATEMMRVSLLATAATPHLA